MISEKEQFRIAVTPHVGVWIETLAQYISSRAVYVTPHVGVWIETCTLSLSVAKNKSHLM